MAAWTGGILALVKMLLPRTRFMAIASLCPKEAHPWMAATMVTRR
jgi:hypothetical protein